MKIGRFDISFYNEWKQFNKGLFFFDLLSFTYCSSNCSFVKRLSITIYNFEIEVEWTK